MTIGSLFSGIGGLELGLEWAGLGPVLWQCECDPYCLAVLEKHWPNVRRYTDVRALDATVPVVDLICGGFPCPPVSVAGKQRAQADDRWLWPEFARVVRLLRPHYVIVENVPGLLTANRGTAFGDVLGSLAALGYDAEWHHIGACDVGAPQRRYRVFIVAWLANRGGDGLEGQQPRGPETRPVVGSGGAEVADARRVCFHASQPESIAGGSSPSLSGGSGPNMEHAASGGLGTLRSTPDARDHRDADGTKQDVADADNLRRVQPEGCIGQFGKRPCNRSEILADADEQYGDASGHGTSAVGRERSEASNLCRSATMADAANPHGRAGITSEQDSERQRGSRSADGDGDVEHAPGNGREDGHGSIPAHKGRAVADVGCHDWPPGPGDAAGWQEYIARYPARKPAILRAQPGLRGSADGLPAWLDTRRRRARLRCLGNAVVPQVAREVGRRLMEIDAARSEGRR